MLNVRFANVLQYACIYLMATSTPPRSQSQSQPQPSPQWNLLYTMTIMNYYQHVIPQENIRVGILSRMAWAQYMPIQKETFKTQSIKSKLILSLYGHLTFIFRHCIINKAPKVAKSIAKVLNQKVAKLPSSSFIVFLLSSFLQMGYISQSWLKVAKLLNCSSFCCFSFSLEI